MTFLKERKTIPPKTKIQTVEILCFFDNINKGDFFWERNKNHSPNLKIPVKPQWFRIFFVQKSVPHQFKGKTALWNRFQCIIPRISMLQMGLWGVIFVLFSEKGNWKKFINNSWLNPILSPGNCNLCFEIRKQTFQNNLLQVTFSEKGTNSHPKIWHPWNFTVELILHIV